MTRPLGTQRFVVIKIRLKFRSVNLSLWLKRSGESVIFPNWGRAIPRRHDFAVG